MALVVVNHLTKKYKSSDRKAVDDVSFEIHPGEIFSLLGPNGAALPPTRATAPHDVGHERLHEVAGTGSYACRGLDADRRTVTLRGPLHRRRDVAVPKLRVGEPLNQCQKSEKISVTLECDIVKLLSLTEEKELQHRHGNEHDHRPLIAEGLDELFLNNCPDSLPHT